MTSIIETIVNSSDIAPIIANLELASTGVSREHLIIALLSMALITTYPDITQEQLRSAVQDVSRYICLVLDDSLAVQEGTDAKQLMN